MSEENIVTTCAVCHRQLKPRLRCYDCKPEIKPIELERRDYKISRLLDAVKAAYRKHHLDDSSIGWDELSELLLDALCVTMGDDKFNEWLGGLTKGGRS